MRRHRLLTSIAVMSASVMQVLDTTIVNVALPQMQGQLGATPDQISWVLTSYLISSGVFMLLTGYFSDRLGQRRYLMISIIGFTIASLLCGIAESLDQLIVFRLLQGIFGAALVPLAQSIMVQTFPREERGRAMAIWGIGVVVGLVMGAVGGAVIPIPSKGFLHVLSLFTPHAHAIEGYLKLTSYGGGVVDILPQVGLLGGVSLLFFLLAMWRLRFD